MAAGREALTRLRWRRRGAWVWPSFVGAVLGEGLLMHLLPVSGDRTQLVGAMLLAGVLNLLVVAGLAPLVGILVRRARPDLPVVVARDYAARGLIVGLGGLIVLLGIGNRGEADAQRRAFDQQAPRRPPVRSHAGPGGLPAPPGPGGHGCARGEPVSDMRPRWSSGAVAVCVR